MALDIGVLDQVDAARRHWVSSWLRSNGLPTVEKGSYYVKSFRLGGAVPAGLDAANFVAYGHMLAYGRSTYR
jgi:hypothetical protein